MLADAAALGGTFRAWLSDTTGSPSTRFDTSFSGSYKLVDGTVVASDGWPDLIDGTLAHPIDHDQIGTMLSSLVWTNTDTAGLPFDGGLHCENWTSAINDAANKPIAGDSTSASTQWTVSDVSNCSFGNRLYCFENP